MAFRSRELSLLCGDSRVIIRGRRRETGSITCSCRPTLRSQDDNWRWCSLGSHCPKGMHVAVFLSLCGLMRCWQLLGRTLKTFLDGRQRLRFAGSSPDPLRGVKRGNLWMAMTEVANRAKSPASNRPISVLPESLRENAVEANPAWFVVLPRDSAAPAPF